MTIDKLITSQVSTNTYIITAGDNAIIIDPGDDFLEIKAFLDERGLSPRYVLLTHEHYDHCNACLSLQQEGAKIYMSETSFENMKKGFHMTKYARIVFNDFIPDELVKDNQVLSLCGYDFRVIATPGHTSGSVCYLTGKTLFSGDTLFCMDVGRTDLPTGDGQELISSVKNRLFVLDEDTAVLPGHSKATTIGTEKKFNRYIK